MKKRNLSLALIGVTAILTSCGGSNQLKTPTNFSLDVDKGTFTFDAVEGGDEYQVSILRRINEATYNSMKSLNATSGMVTKIDISEKESWFLWNEIICSKTRIKEKDGKIDSQFSLRTYSNTAISAGEPIAFKKLAVGDHLIQVIANETSEKEASDPLNYTFTKEGTLAEPSGFKFKVDDNGKINIVAPSNYYYNALTSTGLPSKIKFDIKKGSESIYSTEIDDFSWEKRIQGPTAAFNFKNATIETDKTATKLECEDYTLDVTAVGNGSTIKDASSTGTFDYSYTIPNFEFTYTGSEGTYVGQDKFDLTIDVNGKDRKLTFTKGETPENSDFYYTFTGDNNKFNGTLECKVEQSSNPWEPGPGKKENKVKFTINGTSLSGTYSLDAEKGIVTCQDIKAGSTGGPGGGFPGGPM